MFFFYAGAATTLVLVGLVTSDIATIVTAVALALVAVGAAIKTREV